MIKLEKKIGRKVQLDHVFTKSKEIILTIYPHSDGPYLGFREPRRRDEYKLSLKEAYRQAVLITATKIAVRTKQLKKEQGMRHTKAVKQARREFLGRP